MNYFLFYEISAICIVTYIFVWFRFQCGFCISPYVQHIFPGVIRPVHLLKSANHCEGCPPGRTKGSRGRNKTVSIYVYMSSSKSKIDTNNDGLETASPFKLWAILDICVRFQGQVYLNKNLGSSWLTPLPNQWQTKVWLLRVGGPSP